MSAHVIIETHQMEDGSFRAYVGEGYGAKASSREAAFRELRSQVLADSETKRVEFIHAES